MVVAVGNIWSRRLDAYQRELADIERKMRNGTPPGKRAKLEFRRSDIIVRLIPATIRDIDRNMM